MYTPNITNTITLNITAIIMLYALVHVTARQGLIIEESPNIPINITDSHLTFGETESIIAKGAINKLVRIEIKPTIIVSPMAIIIEIPSRPKDIDQSVKKKNSSQIKYPAITLYKTEPNAHKSFFITINFKVTIPLSNFYP